MKTLLLIFVFTIVAFGQYGANVLTNSTFTAWSGTPPDDDADNWTETEDRGSGYWQSEDNGTCRFVSGAITRGVEEQLNLLEIGANYNIRFEITSFTSGSIEIYSNYPNRYTASAVGNYRFNHITADDDLTIRASYSADYAIDNVYMFLVLDTLWIDANQADETDNDTTKTLVEAFETRGAHSGGYFITVAGTYAESITVDSSFTKWEATGTAIIKSVDFNNVTCVVDLADLILIDKINDNNVTYQNNIKIKKKFKGFSEWNKW